VLLLLLLLLPEPPCAAAQLHRHALVASHERVTLAALARAVRPAQHVPGDALSDAARSAQPGGALVAEALSACGLVLA